MKAIFVLTLLAMLAVACNANPDPRKPTATRKPTTSPETGGRSAKTAKKGLQIDKISPGDGKTFPKKGQTVSVHYTGTLTNGTKFDSSHDRGSPLKFKIGMGQVIKGWDEGIAQLSVGQKAKLTCSPDYAYGAPGYPGLIPPNATLIFHVELVGVEP